MVTNELTLTTQEPKTTPIWMWLYRFFIAPPAVFLALFLSPFVSKIRTGLRLRMRVDYSKVGKGGFWIHASSGEFEYAKPLLRQLRASSLNRLMVTFYSPSYLRQIQKDEFVDEVLPLPLDLPGPVRTFMKRTQPKALLISRTDFWPELLVQAGLFKVPSFVYSMTQKPMSGPAAWIKAGLLNRLDGIFCVSERDRENLAAMGVNTPIVVAGDTRYDQALYRLSHHPKTKFQRIPTEGDENPLCLIAGSTWPQDEEVLLNALSPLLEAKKVFLVLAPHEPSLPHAESLKKKLTNKNIMQISDMEDQNINTQAGHILYVNKVGVLADLYPLADLAFVGGSFKSKVHSVMEPLAAGLITLTGPKNQNNREAQEFKNVNLEAGTAVCEVNTASELRSKLENFLENREKLTASRSQLTELIRSKCGASEKIAAHLSQVLEPIPEPQG